MRKSSIELPTDPTALQEVRQQNRTLLLIQLKRFGLSVVPAKSDPDGQAFWNDPEAIKAASAYDQVTSKIYRLKHPEIGRRYQQTHKLEISEKRREYYEAHRQEHIAQSVAWNRAHPEVSANWYKNNPDKAKEIRREANHRRRARIAGTNGNFTKEEFKALCIEQDNKCSYCEQTIDLVGPLVPDHMTPISRGGDNSIDNITPACSHCNHLKSNKTVEEFLV